jgi:hypothetical protein
LDTVQLQRPAGTYGRQLVKPSAHVPAFCELPARQGHKRLVSTHSYPRRRPTPSADEEWGAVRRLALLAAVALLVAQLASAFAGILVSVVGLAVMAAYAAARTGRP